MYYTTANDNNVYKYDISTNTDLGVAFTVAGARALSTIAYDGTNFWVGDYSGTNQAYLYTPTGTLLKTVSLQDCHGYCDGLEYFVNKGQGFLISNEGDAVGNYDVYDTNGNLVQADLITSTGNNTGIAWDGTHFWVSNIYAGSVSEYGMDGTFMQTLSFTGAPVGYSPLVEDLSFNYSQTLITPEPPTLVLMIFGLIGLVAVARLRPLKA